MTPRQEARLMGRAIRKRWDVPEAVKSDVIATLHDIATSSEKDSARVAAGNALLSAEAQNQKDEHKFIDAIGNGNRFLNIAQRLGIDVDPGDVGQADTTASSDGAHSVE